MSDGRRPAVALLAFLAWRGLSQSRLATLLMVSAVAIGVAFQIPNSANLAGYEHEILRQGVTASFGDVRVRPERGRRLLAPAPLVESLRGRSDVAAAVPILRMAGAVGGANGFEDSLVVGVDHDAAVLPYHLLRGEHLKSGDTTGVVLGSALAGRIGADVGAEIQLRVFLAVGTDLIGEDAIGRYTMTVRGVASGGFAAPSAVFLSRSFLASELGGSPDVASMVIVHAKDHAASGALATEVSRHHPDLRVVAWEDDSPFINAAVRGSATISAVSYAMVMFAVALPVWALLYIGVLHRQRQIAVMAAIGLSRGPIFLVFLMQAFAVGMLGALLGVASGFGLVRYFESHPVFAMEGFVIEPVSTIGIYMKPALIVLAVTVIAGIWPAQRASRQSPTRILRGAR